MVILHLQDGFPFDERSVVGIYVDEVTQWCRMAAYEAFVHVEVVRAGAVEEADGAIFEIKRRMSCRKFVH